MAGFPLFKGLQKPMEFFGIRGRFLYMAAAGIGGAFMGFLIFSSIFNKGIGFAALVGIAGVSYLYVRVKQKQGLHSKQRCRDILVYQNIYRR